MNRRNFLQNSAAIAGFSLLTACQNKSSAKLKLGFDNFSIRALGWKAPRLLEYAAEQKADTVLFSDLGVYESFDDSYLTEIKAQADELGIAVQAGTGGICPTSASFKKTYGTAEEHLTLTLKVAKAVGSDVARCYQGNGRDRRSPGGLKPHMAATVKVCQSVRSLAKDLGVKIAIENHAGDMAAYQLKELIESAGPDYVGATIDSGNAAFTLEDPVENLKILAPYVVCSGIRDTAIWDTGSAIRTKWKAMGQGIVNWHEYFRIWKELCPQAPVQLEIISQYGKAFPHKDEKFWKYYQDIRKEDLDAFKKLAAKGKAAPSHPKLAKEAEQKFQLQDLEVSLKYCREVLGLGCK